MRLQIDYDRSGEEWNVRTAYITDGSIRYGLNPNALGSIRIFGPGDNWEDYDLERLALVHRLLLEARAASPRKEDTNG